MPVQHIQNAIDEVNKAFADFNNTSIAKKQIQGANICATWTTDRPQVEALIAVLTMFGGFSPQMAQAAQALQTLATLLDTMCAVPPTP